MKLSICIPSYNRFQFLYETLLDILKCDSDDFEVVIIDNASTDPDDLIQNIKDHRIKIVKRNEPVSAIINCTEAFLFGSGDYTLLLLDKDRIHGEYLNKFINTLYKHPDVIGGYCIQNKTKDSISNIKIEKNPIKSIFPLRHPSGYFFKKEVFYRVLNKVNPTELSCSAYGGDYFMTGAASMGPIMVYDSVMITTEKPSDCKKTKSYTYTSANLFFSPSMQIYYMNCFEKFLCKIGFSDKVKEQAIPLLIRRCLINSTIGYRNLMQNESVCEHYHISTKKIHFIYLFKYGMRVWISFLKEPLDKYSALKKIYFIFKSLLPSNKYLLR